MKIICYGASNTYGYDPRNPFGRSYEKRWTCFLEEILGYEVVNMGLSGRKIPGSDDEIKTAVKRISSFGEENILLVMLGANDVLSDILMDRILLKMKNFLCRVNKIVKDIIILGEIRIRTGTEYDDKIREFNRMLEILCSELGSTYVDTYDFPLEMSSDGIHMSENDQRVFAKLVSEKMGLESR